MLQKRVNLRLGLTQRHRARAVFEGVPEVGEHHDGEVCGDAGQGSARVGPRRRRPRVEEQHDSVGARVDARVVCGSVIGDRSRVALVLRAIDGRYRVRAREREGAAKSTVRLTATSHSSIVMRSSAALYVHEMLATCEGVRLNHESGVLGACRCSRLLPSSANTRERTVRL